MGPQMLYHVIMPPPLCLRFLTLVESHQRCLKNWWSFYYCIVQTGHHRVGQSCWKVLYEGSSRVYNSAQRRYLDFCSRAGLQPLPATETGLCYFVAYLAKEKLKHHTIKGYLSTVCFLHIGGAETGSVPTQFDKTPVYLARC